MLRFRHNENLAIFQKLIIDSERDPSRDEDRHKMLLRLLAEEEAKDQPLEQIPQKASREGFS
jgi:hypothetical protein